MRNDFAVFILTHGRADNVVTVPAIKKAGYTGKIYFIIDDEDEQAEEYKKNFGADRVIIFDKQAAYDRADTMDNFNDHRAIIYARNECWRIAEELGLKYFLMLDDDYKSIDYRYEEDGKLKYKPSHDFDRVFEDMIQFLEVSGADTVAFLPGRRFRWRSRRRKLPQRIITKGDEQFLLQDRYADRVQGNHERRCCDIYNIEQPGTPVLFKYTILRGTVANPKPVGRNDRCV